MPSPPPPTRLHPSPHALRRSWHRSRPRLHTTLAREHTSSYDAAAAAATEASYTRPLDGPDRPDDLDASTPLAPISDTAHGAADGTAADGPAEVASGALRDAIAEAAAAMGRVAALASDARITSGQLEGLLELLAVVDRGQQAAVALTDRVEVAGLSERSTALPLEGLLSMSSRLPHTERRALVRTAEQLRSMPRLAAAWRAGLVSHGQVRIILAEARRVPAERRGELDASFADHGRLQRLGADELLDAVSEHITALRPVQAERDELKVIERRFLALQPALDGALAGYFELDAEGAATLLDALDAAVPPPSGPQDHTRDATHTPEPNSRWERTASRGRQRADGLVTLAAAFLGGQKADGTTRRPKPRVLVWTGIDTLTGQSDTPGRLLWAAIGGPVTLTAAGIRRLASDATLQFVLHHNGRILGTTAPTATIPTGVRTAVTARDRGCRFPGCTMPIHHCDLHHIQGREHGGPTTCDNLVAVCRRHHTAITNHAWTLTMTPEGTVTVRRGNRTATSDPPHRRTLHPD